MNLVDRDALIRMGDDFKREVPGLNDMQILSILGYHHTVDLCDTVVQMRDPCGAAPQTNAENLATLSFVGLPATRTEGHPDPQAELLESAVEHWKAVRALRINRHNTSGETSTTSADIRSVMTRTEPKGASVSNNQAPAGAASSVSSAVPVNMTEADIIDSSDAQPQARAVKSLASYTKAPPSMSEANHMFGTNTKPKDRGLKVSSASSRIPATTAQAKSSIGSDPKIQGDEAGSSTFTTKARLSWEPSKSGDPFGVRVSTNEFVSDYPFELANTNRHRNVRDNILYDCGYRDATARFPRLSDQNIQPLQPGIDRTPGPVTTHMAANTARTEAAKTEIEATKAKELNVVGTREITTARGLREEITNADPTYIDTVLAAMTAAKLDPVAQVDPDAAYEYIKIEAITKLRAELKAEAKEFRPAVIKEEEYTAQSSTYSSFDAPTEEQEVSGKAWAFPVADRVINAAHMHYDMMYEVVTKLQRDRLELGPEASNYEVISHAHAGYVAADKEQAAVLARASETQKTKALARSVTEQLLEAQAKGRPVTRIGDLKLSQKQIADVLERCQQVSDSTSAANDYINAKAEVDKTLHLYNDPFTQAQDLNLEAARPATIAELIEGARIGMAENAARAEAMGMGHFDAAADKIEKDLEMMKEFKSKIGTTPRDFSKEILEIQQELAELKAHRAAYPGDPPDLFPDSVDDPGYVGIAVRPDDVAEKSEEKEASASTAEAPAIKASRAEQRRAARQKAKGNGKA